MVIAVDHYLVLVLSQMIILLFCLPINASEQLSCSYNCGNVSIRYPFGIGEGCYFNKSFEVICDDSSGSPKAFLISINNLQLLDTFTYDSYDFSSARVNISVISLLSSSKPISNAKSVNLSGSPFIFSAASNRITAVGCDDYATITSINNPQGNISNVSGGCLSICTCDPTQKADCYDFLCTVPPSFGKVFNANILYHYSQNISRNCRSVAMVEENWLVQNYLGNSYVLKDEEQVPAVLEWGKYKGHCFEEYNSYFNICNLDKRCLIPLNDGHLCLCKQYSDGYCSGSLFCPTTGGYNCPNCPIGYSNYSYNYCYRNFNKKFRAKFIIIGCSSGLGLLFLLIGIWRLYKFLKRRREIKLKQKFFKRNGGLLLQQELSSNEGNIDKTKVFTSKELEKATDNYNANRILGQGGQGTVYKGMLADGMIVAVKKSKIVDESNVEQFINEVVILSQINHRNVVKLFGCCLETEVPLLVYEFIPNGTLFQHIHDQTEEFPLTWEMRLRIAVEVSGSLSYLHSAASIPIYHRDIKSANILLDDKYRAKVSDFGASRSVTVDQTHLTTQVQGTFGYVDPEYFRSSQFTEKSDVYSFGVVLVELLTGQKPIRSINSEEDRSLAGYFLQAMKDNRLFETLDARVLKEAEKEEIITVAMLAKRCLNLNGKKRPTMVEVAFELAGIRASIGASVLQQNVEEFDFVDGDITGCFKTGSSSTGSYVSSAAFSLDVVPLVSDKR